MQNLIRPISRIIIPTEHQPRRLTYLSAYLAYKGGAETNSQNVWPGAFQGLNIKTTLIELKPSWKEQKISLCSHENDDDDNGNNNDEGDNGGNEGDEGGEDTELIET
ncbi:MAG TPA: hypothetical protein VNM22_02440 [Candidatus Limnocylindrales bacterium]|nr:hypothetical protein [Candidatus Limnocylindrales bacterium]